MINVFWFKKDLRLQDNTGLNAACDAGLPLLGIFIHDTANPSDIVAEEKAIRLLDFSLMHLQIQWREKFGSELIIFKDRDPAAVFKSLLKEHRIKTVYLNEEYEPYSVDRDKLITAILLKHNVKLFSYKDQVIFSPLEIMKGDGKPYQVFSAYYKNWTRKLLDTKYANGNYVGPNVFSGTLKSGEIPFFVLPSELAIPESVHVENYDQDKDFPSLSTTRISSLLRYGLISIRTIFMIARSYPLLLKELAWREFFIQLLFHFPHSSKNNFRKNYDQIKWRNSEEDFIKWMEGRTGYPLVDAGMRQLNETGYMHNRVRMITASFLTKHLLIDWRWGEGYFASKLLDYSLAQNVGNWQWVAGTGCDAAPYFRIFNPSEQQKRFDPDWTYIKRWVPEYNTENYSSPMVDHKFARERALIAYRQALKGT